MSFENLTSPGGGYACPKCGKSEPMVQAKVLLKLDDNGGCERDEYDWDEHSPCTCSHCGHHGRHIDFVTPMRGTPCQ